MDSKLLKVLGKIETGEIRSAQVYKLVEAYYDKVIYKIDEFDGEMPEEELYPEELLQPLPQRKSGIAQALNSLIDRGFDVDESDGFFNALMMAVGNADVWMTAYLVDHGADLCSWPEMEEAPGDWQANYYLEDIDIHYWGMWEDRDPIRCEALLRTAKLIVDRTGAKNFGGLCLRVDENGCVSLQPPKMLF